MLIAGCGYVGGSLGTLLARNGVDAWGLRRDPSKVPATVHPLAADLVTGRGLENLPDDVPDVVFCPTPAGPAAEQYRDVFVRGLDRLLGALARRGTALRRLVFVSSTAVWGRDDGAWVDEATPPDPPDPQAAVLLEGEALARSATPTACIVRMGGIYGPGRTRLLELVRTGRARRPSRPTWTNRIHRDDCAGALRHLLDLPAAASVYLGVDHEPAELGAVQQWIAEELGVPVPAAGDGAGSTSPGRRHRTNKRCRNDLLVGSGYDFVYRTYREGYRQVLAQQNP